MEFWEKALFVDKISLMIIGANEGSKSSLLQDVLRHKNSFKHFRFEGVGIDKTKDGIFVIDNIEMEMHPTRQREIILQLGQAFPNTQFAISTNSPLCLSGTADVGKDKYKIYKIFLDEDGDEVIEERGIPQGLRVDQVLVDYFDLKTSLNISSEKLIGSLTTEYSKEPKDEKKIKSIQDELKKVSWNLAEVTEDRILQRRFLGCLEEDKERKSKGSIALKESCEILLANTGCCPLGLFQQAKPDPDCEVCRSDSTDKAIDCWIKYFMEEKK